MDTFKFYISALAFGWSDICLIINGKKILFHASYLGIEPLASLILACADLMDDGSEYYISWETEPGSMEITLERGEDNMLSVDIVEKTGDDFPISDFLKIIRRSDGEWKGESYSTDIFKELDALRSILAAGG